MHWLKLRLQQANAQSTATPIIPPVLYASPSVVIETRDASATLLPAGRPVSTDQSTQDAALLALAAAHA